jgi:hypothetical protein
MPSSYTASARFTLQATGENNNTWGVILNQGVFQLVDDSVNGMFSWTAAGVHALSVNNGATDEARMAFLNVTGGSGGSLVLPGVSKSYFVRNASASGLSLQAGGGVNFSMNMGDAGPIFTDGTTIYPVLIGGQTIRAYVNTGDAAQKAYTDAQIAGAVINMPSVVGHAGQVLSTDGAVALWTPEINGPLTIDGAATLKGGASVAGGLTASQTWALTGVYSPAMATGSYNDFDPGAGTTIVRFNPPVGGYVITGIAGGFDGRRLFLLNVSAYPVQLYAGAQGSAVANRFFSFNGWSWTLGIGQGIWVQYDGAAQVWRAEVNGMETLQTARTYYVNAATGDDVNNSGLTAASPLKTIQQALSWVYKKNLNYFGVLIQLADGSYPGTFTLNGPVTGLAGPGQLTIQGNMTTPANVVLNNTTSAATMTALNCAMVAIQGVSFQGTYNSNFLIYITTRAIVNYGTCIFGPGLSHIAVTSGGVAQCTGNYTINGNAAYHFQVNSGSSLVTCTSRTITVTGNPTFSTFALIDWLANLICSASTFTGAATGTRYAASANSVIMTNVGGANFFPGSVAGTVATGAQYV